MVEAEAKELVPATTIDQAQEIPAPEATPIHYPEVVTVRPCTCLECKNGHQWAPMIALARCGHGSAQGWNGCGAPILAVKLMACPVCNEPNTKFRLRIDNTGPVPFPVPMCIPGSGGFQETVEVVIEWNKWKQAEQAEIEKYKKEQSDGSST